MATSQDIELKSRMQDQDNICGARFEFYLTNPAEQPDPEQWYTEIAYQLKDGQPC